MLIEINDLGYLRSENYSNADKVFLESCEHLQDNTFKTIDNYLLTRVGGMCLTDFLEEYATIYSIGKNNGCLNYLYYF